jgi:hypothetical protein
METSNLVELTFLPAPNDYPLRSAEYQTGLRHFADSLEGEKLAIEPELLDGMSRSPAAYSGKFSLGFVSGLVKGGVTAWLEDRPGRQVRIGMLSVNGRRPTAEARTAEDVEQLLTKAEEYIEIMRGIGAFSESRATVEPLQVKLRLLPSLEEQLDGEEVDQFGQTLHTRGLEVSRSLRLLESADAVPLTADFVIKIAAIGGPVLGTCVGAWLNARYGRKVRLEIGDIKAEASTVKEVEALLALAQDTQRRNQPKVIHEP